MHLISYLGNKYQLFTMAIGNGEYVHVDSIDSIECSHKMVNVTMTGRHCNILLLGQRPSLSVKPWSEKSKAYEYSKRQEYKTINNSIDYASSLRMLLYICTEYSFAI